VTKPSSLSNTVSSKAHLIAYVGLGSNLEQPEAQINSALKALAGIPESKVINSSHWYCSKAIGPGDQPDYINAAVMLETQLIPIELLHQLQAIENSQGRQRNIRWGARTLDLDLLLCTREPNNHVRIDSDELQLPHPEIMQRNFVLYPLYDVAPELIMPNGEQLQSIINNQCQAYSA